MATVSDFADFHPPYLFPEYELTVRRVPAKRLVELPKGWFHYAQGPVYGRIPVRPADNDLTSQRPGKPIGQRIVLSGRVIDSDGRGVPGTLIEIWQCNANGRYLDANDPGYFALDSNFTGAGRVITDCSGHYWFRTIKPPPYPGSRGWRQAHIHVSLFGQFGYRLVTQCYFEGDPLLARDSNFRSIPDPRAAQRLVAHLNIDASEPSQVDAALAYEWDIVIRGSHATPVESPANA